MKTHLTILALILTLISCETKHSGTTKETIKLNCGDINIKLDTFNLSTKEEFAKAIIYHDKYYLVFQKADSYTGEPRKKILIVDTIGNVIGKVSLPEGDLKDMSYFDLSVENDSLFIKKTNSLHESTFVLNEKEKKLKATKDRLLIKYQDNEYSICLIDRGEFGSNTFFKNKKTMWTGKVNTGCLYSAPIVINRIDSNYYITNSSRFLDGYARILKINHLTAFKEPAFKFDKNKYISHNGIEMVLDTAKIYMSTCFVVNKKLLCIYTVENGTYIGEFIDKKVKPLYKFKMKFDATLTTQFENGLQILSLYFLETKKTGILTIDKNNIEFHTIN